MERKHLYDQLNILLSEPRVERLYRKTRSIFGEIDTHAHNWEHVRRDIVNSVQIGMEENADMDIVMPAIILHDLGYATHPDDPEKHPLNGSKECYLYLGEWTAKQQDHIASCILKHKGKFPGFEHAEPETLEEKVVCDADQLDKFGWIGFIQLVKVFVEHGTKGNSWFNTMPGLAEAISHQGAIKLYTPTARGMAEELREPDFMEISEKLKDELSVYTEWSEPFKQS